jgi:hypothetical protein
MQNTGNVQQIKLPGYKKGSFRDEKAKVSDPVVQLTTGVPSLS